VDRNEYELNNHLGNVFTTVSDRRKLVCSTTSFEADVINTYDYSPFGAPLPGRSLGALKCSNYTIHSTLYPINEDFNTYITPVNILNIPSPTVLNYYINTPNTTGKILNGRIKLQKQGGGGITRGVAKNFSVVSGKSYNVKFKLARSGAAAVAQFGFRIVDNATNLVVPGTNFTYASINTYPANTAQSYANLFTPSANGTYRVEFYWTASANVDLNIDDVQIYYEDVVVSQVCVPTGEGSRFMFNGKEQDPEMSGEGNSYDYGFRMYSARLGKFISVDPFIKHFGHYSSYQFAGNSPISSIDFDGLQIVNAAYNYANDGTRLLLKTEYSQKVADRIDEVISLIHSDDAALFDYVNQYDIVITAGHLEQPHDGNHYGHIDIQVPKLMNFKNEAEKLIYESGNSNYWNDEREKSYAEDDKNGDKDQPAFKAWNKRFNDAYNSGPVTAMVGKLTATITIDIDKIDEFYRDAATDPSANNMKWFSVSTAHRTGKHEIAHFFLFAKFIMPLPESQHNSYGAKEEKHARKIGNTYDDNPDTQTDTDNYDFK